MSWSRAGSQALTRLGCPGPGPVHRPLPDWAEVVLSRPDLFTVWSFYVLAVIRQTSASKRCAFKTRSFYSLVFLCSGSDTPDIRFKADVLGVKEFREKLSSDIGRSIEISIDDDSVF